jgi:hemoglobin-like flavoprotein
MALNPELLKACIERAKHENGGMAALGNRFYKRLFQHYPQVRSLFPEKMDTQAAKLMAALGWIVANVENADVFKPYIEDMAVRHLDYGTLQAHYPAVGENLLAVLEEHLSAEGTFTLDMKTAWADAYQAIADIMMTKAYPPASAA